MKKAVVAILIAVLVAVGFARPLSAATGTASKPTLVKSTSSLFSPDVLSLATVDGSARITMTALQTYNPRAAEYTKVTFLTDASGQFEVRTRCKQTVATYTWSVYIDGVKVASALLKCA